MKKTNKSKKNLTEKEIVNLVRNGKKPPASKKK